MKISVGSLFSEDQRLLEELDLLPANSDEEESETEPSSSALETAMNTSSSVIVPSIDNPDISRSFRRGTADGIPWFEEMMEGSRLGRLMRARRGMGFSDDQSTSFEWEITEWHDDGAGYVVQEDDSSGPSIGKRKRDQQVEAESKPKRA